MEKLLTSNEVAEILNCRPNTVYVWAEKGKLPSLKIHGLVRFDKAAVEAFIRSCQVASPAPAPKIRTNSITNIDSIVDRAISDVIGHPQGNRTRVRPGKEGE